MRYINNCLISVDVPIEIECSMCKQKLNQWEYDLMFDGEKILIDIAHICKNLEKV